MSYINEFSRHIHELTIIVIIIRLLTNELAFKERGGSLPPLHKPAIGLYLQQELSNL